MEGRIRVRGGERKEGRLGMEDKNLAAYRSREKGVGGGGGPDSEEEAAGGQQWEGTVAGSISRCLLRLQALLIDGKPEGGWKSEGLKALREEVAATLGFK